MNKSDLDRANLQYLLDNSKDEFWAIFKVNTINANIFNTLFFDPYIRIVDSDHNIVIFSFSLTKSGLRHDIKIYDFDFCTAFKSYIFEWERHTFDGNPDLCAIRNVLLTLTSGLDFKHPNAVIYE